jgi:ribosomal protein L13
VIINAEKLVLTGKKMQEKKYYHHTGYRRDQGDHGWRSSWPETTELIRGR